MWKIVLGLCLAVAGVTSAAADPYPTRPIRIIVPYGPGVAPDVIVRLYVDVMKSSGIHFFIENQPQAYGVVGTRNLYHAEPDGYTMGVISASLLYPHKEYDAQRFEYVSVVSRDKMFLVVPSASPVRTLQELIASVPKNYSAPNPGAQRFAAEFMRVTGLTAVQLPYRGGSAAAVLDLKVGRVDYTFLFGFQVKQGIDEGILRPLAVVDPERSLFIPEVPTMNEALLKAGRSTLPVRYIQMGVVFPPGTPPTYVQKLAQLICTASRDEELRERLRKTWVEAICSTPKEYRAFASGFQ